MRPIRLRVLVLAPLAAHAAGLPLAAQRAPAVAGRVLDAGGAPAAGARVHLVARRHPELPGRIALRLGRDAQREQTATTDPDGRFRVGADGPGPFGVWASAPAGLTGMAFPVAPGDFLTLRLEPPETTEVRVTEHVDAPAIDLRAAGQSVEARVLPDDFAWARDLPYPAICLQARTDDEGTCRFAIPKDRHFRLSTTLGRHSVVRWPVPTDGAPVAVRTYPRAPYRGRLLDHATGKPVAGALVHELHEPENLTVTDAAGEFTLLAHPVAFLHVVPRAHQRGVLGPQLGSRRALGEVEEFRVRRGRDLAARLTGADGEPLREVRIVLAGLGTGLRESRFPSIAVWQDRLDREGRLRAHWLEPGVPLAAFVESEGRFVWFLFRASGGDLDLGTVRIAPSARIEGKVDAPDRTPLVGAHVYLQPAMPGGEDETLLEAPPGFFSRMTCTDRGGRFCFDGLQPGDYELAVDAAGRARLFTTARASAGAKPLALTLADGAVLRGRVVDPRPVPGAEVTVTIQPPAADWRLAAWRFDLGTYRTTTGADGRFMVAGLPGGSTCTVRVHRHRGDRVPTATAAVDPAAGEVLLELSDR